MKNFFKFLASNNLSTYIGVGLLLILSNQLASQCTAQSGNILGSVYIDSNNDGVKDPNELGNGGVVVSVYDSNGFVKSVTSKSDGNFIISDLSDNTRYRLEYIYQGNFKPSFMGASNGSSVQFVTPPSCEANLGLINYNALCSANPEVITTCFVQGPTGNSTLETIIGFDYQFTSSTVPRKYAMHSETGSIWGLTWKSTTSEIFSAAFVKQYAGLTSHGPGAILKTTPSGAGYKTELYADLATSVGVGTLTSTDINDCAYGNLVGHVGLGALVLDGDQEYLYVTNLGNKSLVKISTTNPKDVTEYAIPDPGCSDGEYVPFALHFNGEKLYIGITCTATTSKLTVNSKAIVYEWDPKNTSQFSNIFETNYLQGYWHDSPSNSIKVSQWFTDIDFTDDGNMVIGFTDRTGHKYCKSGNNRLDNQHPDILMVYKDASGVWKLESNGMVGPVGNRLTGSGVGNQQGPGGGEFFGEDDFPGAPTFHPEVALGSFYVLPGQNSIASAAFDPEGNPTSGGFHLYDTKNGKRLSTVELYTRNSSTLFGKATGFGDIIAKCGAPSIEIGNYVWNDLNNNGLQDPNEDPISGLTLNLLDTDCNIVASATTNQFGQYKFSNIIADKDYFISVPTTVFNADFGLLTVGGTEYTFTISGNLGDNIDNNASVLDVDCDNVIIPIKTNVTNHNFDIGLVKPSGFDLALKKELLSSDIAHWNEVIPFKITIYNQGGIPAKDIKVIDYIAEGYEFSPLDNPTWKLIDGNAVTTIAGPLVPGANTYTIIRLKLISIDVSKLVNIAEIESAKDFNGNDAVDIDSNMDNDNGNDVGGDVGTSLDDLYTDDGTIDEDDSDPAVPNIFDLALTQYYDESCITGGSQIVVKVNVFNQGNVAAKSFKVVNYGAPNLVFNDFDNPAWKKVGGLVTYEGGALAPGSKITIDLKFDVINLSQNVEIVNIAEISSSIPEGGTESDDSDSTPDDDENNDKGGKPNTSDDNYIFGTPDLEEDDHDPLVLNSRYVDLALIITTKARVVEKGDVVCFKVTVFNQGHMPIKKFTVTDYMPEELEMLPNQGWTVHNSKDFNKEFEFANSFAPGDTFEEEFCMKVGDITNKYVIVNFAEISQIIGMCDEDLSSKDIDSKADDDSTNDAGGRPLTNTDDSINEIPSIDEDDHDPAILINYSTSIPPATACDYKSDATMPGNGMIGSTIVLNAPSGMVWTLDQAIGYFDPSSTAGVLIPFAPNTVLVEGIPSNGESTYTLIGEFVSGKPYDLRFVSDNNDYAYVKSGVVCAYKTSTITGPLALCTDQSATYSVQGNATDIWLGSVVGGAITSSSNNGKTIEVAWAGPGQKEVRFENQTDPSFEPVLLKVVAGSADNAMKCRSISNLSLDVDCSVEILPSHISLGNPDPNAAYTIMANFQGTPIPGNIVDASYVGKTIEVKLIEGCGGNSCWGNILVEDKMAPTILCDQNITVSCYKVDQYRGPVAQDNCGNPITLHTLDSLYTQVMCNPTISGTFLKKYQAVDGYGNKSKVCEQTITIEKVRLDSIKFPANFKMADALNCKGNELDENGFPVPSLTGIPTLEGDAIYPEFDALCNLYVTYEDEGPYPFECATKFIRKWTVWDLSCISNPTQISKEQTVIFGDKTAPTFTCPTAITASASQINCEAKVTLPPATNFADDCSTTFKVDMTYPGGIKENQNGNLDVFLPVGINTITYRVSDDCKRSNECSFTVTVSDKTAPLAVCDKNTTVALLPTGDVYAFAKTFDDGSWDACGIVSFEARRMDLGSNCGVSNSNFGNIVEFCCADVNPTTPVIVELKVTDANNNTNLCMVNVFIQDKTKPVIACPDNVTISCMDIYDLNNLQVYGSATITDECGLVTDTVVINNQVDQCRVGFIDRTFIVSDGSNSDQCTQRISIVNNNPFTINSITKPLDYLVENMCGAGSLHPDSLPAAYGYPVINEGICDLVAPTFKDKRFVFDSGDGTCFKIIRRWTVINYCHKVGGVFDEIAFDQVIKVRNLNPPIITIKDSTFVEAPLDSADCERGTIELEASAVDSCKMNNDLNWTYQIFLENATTPIQLSGTGGTAMINRDFPLGNHYVLWSFEDMCGNVATERQDFRIFDNNKPTCVVLDTVAIGLVPMDLVGNDGIVDTEMACIGPDSLNVSSYHPCIDNDLLTFSFSSDGTMNEMCFDCFDLGINSFSVFVLDPNGNFDECIVKIIVQDNNDVDLCPSLDECITWPKPLHELITCNADTTATLAGLGIASVSDTCICQSYIISHVDVLVNDLITCKAFDRIWTVEFTCGNSQKYEFTQQVFIKNAIAPEIICPKDITVTANVDCEAEVILNSATSANDDCNTGVTIANDSDNATNPNENASGTYPVGEHTVIFTVSDACNNSNTCTTIISVIDDLPPVAMCSDITINLNANGTYSLTPADQDLMSNGSFDNCNLVLTYSKKDFDCTNVGVLNSVTVTASDGNLSSTCTSNVTVLDLIPPTAICSDFTLTLVGNSATITQAQINNLAQASTDNCPGLQFAGTGTYNCDNVGIVNNLVITVTDASSNTSTCTSVITVEDNTEPVAACNNISINLNAQGAYTLTLNDINAIQSGSSDNCSFTPSVTPSTFDCSNVSITNTVTLTVTDASNNTDTCTATVTVLDVTPPTAQCLDDYTVTLNATGMAVLMASDLTIITAGSSDACGYEVTPNAMFDCDDLGTPVDVTITLTDPSNNTSTCVVTVTVEEGGTPTLECSDITVYLDENGVYTLSTMDTMDMLMLSSGSCETSITISQTTFDCTDVPSVDVTVTLLDGLGATLSTCISTVTVSDTIAPIANCSDISVNLDSSGNYSLSPADINNIDNNSTDACGISNLSVTPNTFSCEDIGSNTVTLSVMDNNGNIDTCSATVTVADLQKITKVCNDISITVVSGQIYELTAIDSAALVAGSFDNCDFRVEFWPAEFTCADVSNSPIQVAIDFYNSQEVIETSCLVYITVISENTLVCKTKDITVYLDSTGQVTITPDDIDDGSGAGCDATIMKAIDIDEFTCNDFLVSPVTVTLTVSTSMSTLTCTAEVTVIDTIAPEIFGCKSLTQIACDTFDGNFDNVIVYDSIWDNCSFNSITQDTLINSFNNCGQGTLSRNIIIVDAISGINDTCNAVIQIIGTSTPLVLGDFNLPADITVDNCSASDTSITGSVSFIGATPSCSFIDITFTDDPSVPTGMCTDTIIRTWTMVDTCNATNLTYNQQIVVIDTLAPMLVINNVLAPNDTLFVANPNNDCEVLVDLSTIVSNTDCGLGGVETNDSEFATDTMSIDASGLYPVGTYTITVTASDACDNSDTISYVIVIAAAEYSITCQKIFVNIDSTQMVCVPATAVATVTGLCDDGADYELRLRDFSTGILSDTLKYSCDSLGDHTVIVYLFRNGVLFDSCTQISELGKSIITVRDPQNYCGNTIISKVGGSVLTNNNQLVEAVNIKLEGSEFTTMTDANGNYSFPDMPSGGDYMVKPSKNDGLLEGVSTLDLILIQRHILKIESLHNNYNIIAADINNDDKVTASDLVDLRKAILGLESSFKNNTSWKMVDAAYQFPVANSPFEERYPVEHEVPQIQGRMIVDFVGVKIGDVNGSYVSNARNNASDNRSSLGLQIQDKYLAPNETATLDVVISEVEEMYGLQLALEIDGLTELVNIKISSGAEVDYNIIGQTVLISLSETNAFSAKDLGLSIEFRSSKTDKVSNLVTLSNAHFDNELYDGNLNRSNVSLDWEGIKALDYEFTQNTPNPWKDKTYLEFVMPEDNRSVSMTISDISGKTVHSREIESVRGLNKIVIKDRDVDMKSGVFIITLDIGGTRLQQKMIRLN